MEHYVYLLQMLAHEGTRVAGRGVFMEELLAELEQLGVPFQAEEVGAII